jgi:hypothetical protein
MMSSSVSGCSARAIVGNTTAQVIHENIKNRRANLFTQMKRR